MDQPGVRRSKKKGIIPRCRCIPRCGMNERMYDRSECWCGAMIRHSGLASFCRPSYLKKKGMIVSPYFWNSFMGLGPSSRIMELTSSMTFPHFAPSDAETKVILNLLSSSPMFFIRDLIMNILFAAL